jgi:hypothetical protein
VGVSNVSVSALLGMNVDRHLARCDSFTPASTRRPAHEPKGAVGSPQPIHPQAGGSRPLTPLAL